jgi:hypothetical protein
MTFLPGEIVSSGHLSQPAPPQRKRANFMVKMRSYSGRS